MYVKILAMGENLDYYEINTNPSAVSNAVLKTSTRTEAIRSEIEVLKNLRMESTFSCIGFVNYGPPVRREADVGHSGNYAQGINAFFKKAEDYAFSHGADHALVHDFEFGRKMGSTCVSGLVQLLAKVKI